MLRAHLSRTVCLMAGLTVLAAGLNSAPVTAQGAARQALPTPPVEVVDATGKVLGPVLAVEAVGGPLGGATPDVNDLVAIVLLRVSGQVAAVGVARDHFVSAPVFTAHIANLNLALPVFVVAFEGPSCTGNTFLTSVLNNGQPSLAPSLSALLRRTAVGPGNVLYVESGAEASASIASLFDPVRQACTAGVVTTPAFRAEVLADLDELFTQPFTLR